MTSKIRAATASDLPAVCNLLAHAYRDDPLIASIIPTPDARYHILADLAALTFAAAIDGGDNMLVTADLSAAACWGAASSLPALADTQQHHLVELAGPAAERLLLLTAALRPYHPLAGYEWINFLAVHPGRSRHGAGSSLLRYQHQRLLAFPRPAFAIATSDPVRRFLAIHGYRAETPVQIDSHSPPAWPMIRAFRQERIGCSGNGHDS